MRGGGTSQAGQAIGPGLVVDTSKYLQRILDINVAERWARVEPGLVLDELNAQLKPHGLRFAPDISTASRATIGGMMANNSSGARSVLYGKTIDHVLEQEVVLANGEVVHFGPMDADALARKRAEHSLEGDCYRAVSDLAERHRDEIERRYPRVLRRVGGYNLDEFVKADRPFNLAKLMVGSEGTLGVVLSAKVNLVPLPKAKAVMAIQFASLLESLAATPLILRHGPSAVEVMDKSILDHTRQSAVLEALRQSFIQGDPAALLCVEFYADHAEDLPPRLAALERDLRDHQFRLPLSPRARPGGTGAHLESSRSRARPVDGDEGRCEVVVVRRRHGRCAREAARLHRTLPRHRPAARHDGRRLRARVGWMSACPAGRQHEDRGRRAHVSRRSPTTSRIWCSNSAARSQASTATGWCAVRSWRRCSARSSTTRFARSSGPSIRTASSTPARSSMRRRSRRTCASAPAYVTRSVPTYFDYSDYGGMAGAVEMCSGLGACRKTLEGTMCPSYMATRDEQHTTRGRANVLRLTMSGRLGESGLGDEGVYDTLDLCLECRACKAECPVGVDVARFKSEFLADYWQRHGTPLHARALGQRAARRANGAAGSRRCPTGS